MVSGVELIPVIDTQSRLMIYYRAKSGKYRLADVSCPLRINKTPADAQLEANICQLTQSHAGTFVGKMPRFELTIPNPPPSCGLCLKRSAVHQCAMQAIVPRICEGLLEVTTN